jgi:CheY-like chemotaxis protein
MGALPSAKSAMHSSLRKQVNRKVFRGFFVMGGPTISSRRLSVMDGLEAIAAIRSETIPNIDKDITIFALTAHAF